MIILFNAPARWARGSIALYRAYTFVLTFYTHFFEIAHDMTHFLSRCYGYELSQVVTCVLVSRFRGEGFGKFESEFWPQNGCNFFITIKIVFAELIRLV